MKLRFIKQCKGSVNQSWFIENIGKGFKGRKDGTREDRKGK